MNLFLKIFPNGYSSKQADELHKRVFNKYGNPYLDKNVIWPNRIKRLEQIRTSLSMLESCYVYGELNAWVTKYYDKYLSDYEHLGGTKEDFDQCISLQMTHLNNKMTIIHGVHTDSEGVTYNGIADKDECCYYEYL